MTAPRIYFAQARDGLFFRRFAAIHPRFQTPHLSILMFGAWSALLAITGTYETLAAYAMYAAWVFYGLTALGVVALRRAQPLRARPYRMTGYPVTLLVFAAVALGFVVNTFVATPGPAIVGTLLIAAGVPVYFIWKRRDDRIKLHRRTAARVTLRLAAPAILVASLLLLPFLNKPFTIDDPLFLREAKHALVDPLHPADFEQVWNAGDRLKLSQYLLGGTLPAYVLAPVAALGGREWMAHLYQLLLLCGFLIASVSVALRLGCDRRQANTVGLLIASNPVTLAMAATCMPDVMAAMFGMAGMDRLLLFREERRWGAGLASGLLLAAAVLCRASTAPLLLVAALLLMPATGKRAAECLWPLGVAAVVVAVFVSLNRGPAANATVGAAFQLLTSLRNVPRNLVAFLCYQALTGPLLVYALLSSGRKFACGVAASGGAGSGAVHGWRRRPTWCCTRSRRHWASASSWPA